MWLWIGSNKYVDEITCLPCMCTCRYVHVYLCVYVCMYTCVCVHMCEWAQAHASQAHAQAMSHTNESCHISMSHVTYQWVMSHINESCHISMSHVTYQWVLSLINESYQADMEQACHIWICHGTQQGYAQPQQHLYSCCLCIYIPAVHQQLHLYSTTYPYMSRIHIRDVLYSHVCICGPNMNES